MHANVTHTVIDMTRWEVAAAGIEAVKQRLSSLEGFEGAYWMAPIEGRGLMVSFWKDEASARAAAPPAGFSPAPGVTVDRVELREVIDRA